MSNKRSSNPPPPKPATRRQVLKQVVAVGSGIAAMRLLEAEASATHRVRQKHFTTRDGATLNYLESGAGQPLVMIPGWSQTAAMFSAQIAAFSRHFRVIAVDMRGHGDSEKVSYGYRIARLAKDLRELIRGLDLDDVILLGHSMGCSIIWSYWDNFGHHPIDRLVLVDEAPALTAAPDWTPEETVEAGAIFTPQSLYDTAAGLRGPDGVAVSEALVGSLFSPSFPPAQFDAVIQENLKLPRAYAAALLLDHGAQDWRDVIPRIDVPTLVIGGDISVFNPASQAWIADQIPGAEQFIFGAAQSGSHFMFLENPTLFNSVVLDFLR